MTPTTPPPMGLAPRHRPMHPDELGAVMLDEFARRFIIRHLKAKECVLAPALPAWLKVRMSRLAAGNPWLNASVQLPRDVVYVAGEGAMVKWGACGHPLREKRVVVGSDGSTAIIRTYPPWCQVCATADDTTEACNMRALKAKPQTFTMKVTSVTPAPPGTYGPGDYGPESFGGSDFPEVADMSGFVPGMAVDFIDGSGRRAEERERWRGREQEANEWECDGTCNDGDFGIPAGTHWNCPTGFSRLADSSRADAEALTRARGNHRDEARLVGQGEFAKMPDDAFMRVFIEVTAEIYPPGQCALRVVSDLARLCPRRSHGEIFLGDTYLGAPIPRPIAREIRTALAGQSRLIVPAEIVGGWDDGHGGGGIIHVGEAGAQNVQWLEPPALVMAQDPEPVTWQGIGDLIAQHAPEAYAAAINQTSSLITGGFNTRVKNRKGRAKLSGITE